MLGKYLSMTCAPTLLFALSSTEFKVAQELPFLIYTAYHSLFTSKLSKVAHPPCYSNVIDLLLSSSPDRV